MKPGIRQLSVSLLLIVAAAPMCWNLAAAEDKQELTAEETKKVTELIKLLGDEDFGTREKAEGSLVAMGPNILPRLRSTVTATKDEEVRARCHKVIKQLALDVETDPEKLAAYAREEAQAKRYDWAERYYSRAVERYKIAAEKAANADAKKDLEEKGKKAGERQKRAKIMGEAEASGDQILIQNGQMYRMRNVNGNTSMEFIGRTEGDSDGW